MRRYNSENDVACLEGSITNDSVIMYGDSLRSLPDVSIHNSSRMIELEMQIEQLKQTLQAANTEVDNLILQNNDLQRELENCQMVIKSLRAIQTLGPEKIRGMSPKPASSLNKTHLFNKIQKNAVTQTDDNPSSQNTKIKRNKRIKLLLKPKIKYATKNLLKKIKIQNKRVRKLQKELKNLKIEKNRIQHKLLELETLTKLKISTKVQKKQEIIHKQENYSSKLQGKGNKIETSERDRAQSGKRKENTKTLTRIEMFSDRIGSGLAIKLMQQLENTKITNYCQTGGKS
ncbi:unnamed protein product [Parnassius apollo]|uniref:(apollo) hypothetical protein n=1 Tax=Parnassius apollo TaxID=110799 RepID=A0A8S3XLF2_PARAO|nr:unnamed protein product [Parnassius apollo]